MRSASNPIVVAMVGCGVVAAVLLLGAASSGNQAATFEYRIVDRYELIRNAAAEMSQQVQDTPPEKRNDVVVAGADMAGGIIQEVEDALNKLGADGWELVGVSEEGYILSRSAK